GVAARERIADHDHVAVGGDVVRVVALAQADAQRLELGGHRRVHGLVAALDRVAELARERRDAAHEGAGDAEDVQFHRGGGRGRWGRRQPTSRLGAIASMMRVNTSSRLPTPSTTVSWPCWR